MGYKSNTEFKYACNPQTLPELTLNGRIGSLALSLQYEVTIRNGPAHLVESKQALRLIRDGPYLGIS